jgi:hypothetical protein
MHGSMHGSMAEACNHPLTSNADVKVENTSKGATIKIEAKDKTDVSQVQAHAQMMKNCLQQSASETGSMRQGRSGSMGGSSQTSPSSSDTSTSTSGASDPAATESPAGGTSPMGAEPASDPNKAKDEKDPRTKSGAGGQ